MNERFENCKEIAYQDCVNMKFKRTDISDSVVFSKTGCEPFLLQKQISDTFYFDWDFETRKAELVRTDKKGINVLNRLPIANLEMLYVIHDFLTVNKKFREGYSDPWANFDQICP